MVRRWVGVRAREDRRSRGRASSAGLRALRRGLLIWGSLGVEGWVERSVVISWSNSRRLRRVRTVV